MIKKISMIVISVIVLFSCSNDFFSDAIKRDVLPEITKPNVESFMIENKLEINWDYDELVDEYILYKDTNPNGNFSYIAYKGSNISFTDVNVINDTFYYYKLAKKQGKKEFAKSNYSVGVCKDVKKDECENNNSRDTAVELVEIVTDANIYFYKDSRTSLSIEDKDWYKVTLPPMRRLVLGFHKVKEGGFSDSGELLFNVEYGMPQEIADYGIYEETYMVENTGYITKTLYFQLSINKTKMNPNFSGSYTKFGSYTIERQRIEVINNF